MPSSYKKPGSWLCADFTPNKIEECLESIRSGWTSQRKQQVIMKFAEVQLKISWKINYWKDQETPHEERTFASHIVSLSEFLFLIDELDFKFIVEAYLVSQGQALYDRDFFFFLYFLYLCIFTELCSPA